MAFESLSFRAEFPLSAVPLRWLPLIHLYDADLPLFPIYYMHASRSEPGRRPGDRDRVFGYVERVTVNPESTFVATVVTNKDLSQPANALHREAFASAVAERFGVADRVTRTDVLAAFQGDQTGANGLLDELWERVVADAYGDALPFGRLWDEVLGLARFVASFRSQSGRKGELIQTHYFASRFGERIQTGGGIPPLDFFLLPSIDELQDPTIPLSSFPAFRRLVDASLAFCDRYCSISQVGDMQLASFKNPGGTQLSNAKFLDLVKGLPVAQQEPLTEAFNAMGKGAHRTIILIMMLNDLRGGQLHPGEFTSAGIGEAYTALEGTYLSPKVVSLYAQQCFGNRHALPVDLWVEAFLKWPLAVWPVHKEAGHHRLETVLRSATNLGKVERLIWVAAQARKVHSSACDDALWCLKKTSESPARGANPLACGICNSAIRNRCPAFHHVRDLPVAFNADSASGFRVDTSEKSQTAPGQRFVRSVGRSRYVGIVDDFSAIDAPEGLRPFPVDGGLLPATVGEFVSAYHH